MTGATVTRFALLIILAAGGIQSAGAQRQSRAVLQPSRSPLVTFRILFMTGSAFDPVGKEGLAPLTAAMIAQGGSRTFTRSQVDAALYPMASSVNFQVDKEMTVFSGTVHAENLESYYRLFRDMLLDPGFRDEDFRRIRTAGLNFLKVTLRQSDDEELAKEHLYNTIYSGHAYGHHNRGRVSSVEKITIEDIRAFYRSQYTQANLVIGLAGGYPASLPEQLDADFRKLPQGTADERHFGPPKLASGTHIEIIERDTRSTAISFGFPIEVNRSSKDWPALAVAVSYLGQHRSSNGRLFNRLREARGLNYGDYAYIEYFPRGGSRLIPEANLGRQQQIFQIWVRPVEAENGLFALRAALYEYDTFAREGLTREQFEASRDFLVKYGYNMTATQDLVLGYALDSRYYGLPDFNTLMRDALAKLSVEDVNRAIGQYLRSDRLRIVMVTKDGAALREAILKNERSPIRYNSPKPKDILDEDKVIEAYRIDVKPEDVVVISADQAFQ